MVKKNSRRVTNPIMYLKVCKSHAKGNMADFDFLEGFDMDGDWGFNQLKEKVSEEQSKQTETVVKQTAEGTITSSF